MDEERRLASLTAFYFGRKVARAPHRDEVIQSAAYKAYPDVRRTIWGMASHPQASELKEATRDKIVSFVHSLEDIRSQEQFDQQHQAWCEDVVAYYQAHPHRDRPSFQFRYGHAQKWLNMTLKYLAVLGHPTVERVYDFLHAPVDRDVGLVPARCPPAESSVVAARWGYLPGLSGRDPAGHPGAGRAMRYGLGDRRMDLSSVTSGAGMSRRLIEEEVTSMAKKRKRRKGQNSPRSEFVEAMVKKYAVRPPENTADSATPNVQSLSLDASATDWDFLHEDTPTPPGGWHAHNRRPQEGNSVRAKPGGLPGSSRRRF